MKNNILSVTNCLTVDTIGFDLMYIRKKREHKIDPCGVSKKSKQNKIRNSYNNYTHFICFFSRVINILHRT